MTYKYSNLYNIVIFGKDGNFYFYKMRIIIIKNMEKNPKIRIKK